MERQLELKVLADTTEALKKISDLEQRIKNLAQQAQKISSTSAGATYNTTTTTTNNNTTNIYNTQNAKDYSAEVAKILSQLEQEAKILEQIKNAFAGLQTTVQQVSNTTNNTTNTLVNNSQQIVNNVTHVSQATTTMGEGMQRTASNMENMARAQTWDLLRSHAQAIGRAFSGVAMSIAKANMEIERLETKTRVNFGQAGEKIVSTATEQASDIGMSTVEYLNLMNRGRSRGVKDTRMLQQMVRASRMQGFVSGENIEGLFDELVNTQTGGFSADSIGEKFGLSPAQMVALGARVKDSARGKSAAQLELGDIEGEASINWASTWKMLQNSEAFKKGEKINEADKGTAERQIQDLKNEINSIMSDFGKALLPVLKDGVGLARDIVDIAKKMPDGVKESIAGVIGAIGALGVACRTVIPAITGVKAIMSAIGGVLGFGGAAAGAGVTSGATASAGGILTADIATAGVGTALLAPIIASLAGYGIGTAADTFYLKDWQKNRNSSGVEGRLAELEKQNFSYRKDDERISRGTSLDSTVINNLLSQQAKNSLQGIEEANKKAEALAKEQLALEKARTEEAKAQLEAEQKRTQEQLALLNQEYAIAERERARQTKKAEALLGDEKTQAQGLESLRNIESARYSEELEKLDIKYSEQMSKASGEDEKIFLRDLYQREKNLASNQHKDILQGIDEKEKSLREKNIVAIDHNTKALEKISQNFSSPTPTTITTPIAETAQAVPDRVKQLLAQGYNPYSSASGYWGAMTAVDKEHNWNVFTNPITGEQTLWGDYQKQQRDIGISKNSLGRVGNREGGSQTAANISQSIVVNLNHQVTGAQGMGIEKLKEACKEVIADYSKDSGAGEIK